MNRDKALRAVKALHAKTVESGATSEEAESAFVMALELMRKHNIQEHELRKSDFQAKTDPEEAVYIKVPLFSAKITHWYGRLAIVICEDLVKNCSVVWDHWFNGDKNRWQRCLTFYGEGESVHAAIDLYKLWKEEITQKAVKLFNGSQRGPGNSYCAGFVEGLAKAIKAAEKHSNRLAGSQELVVIQNAVTLHNNWLSTARTKDGMNTKDGAGSKASYDISAYKQGLREGEASSINKQIK